MYFRNKSMVYKQGVAYSPHKDTEWWHFMFLILDTLVIFSNPSNYCTNNWSKQNNACVIMQKHRISGSFSCWCLETLPYFVDVKWQQVLHHLCSVSRDLRGFDHSSITWRNKPDFYFNTITLSLPQLLSCFQTILATESWLYKHGFLIQIYRFLRTHIYIRCFGLP